jgi:hypothetical protein
LRFFDQPLVAAFSPHALSKDVNWSRPLRPHSYSDCPRSLLLLFRIRPLPFLYAAKISVCSAIWACPPSRCYCRPFIYDRI